MQVTLVRVLAAADIATEQPKQNPGKLVALVVGIICRCVFRLLLVVAASALLAVGIAVVDVGSFAAAAGTGFHQLALPFR